MRVGYARVSRKDQRLEPQRDALLADGCERVFEEKVSSREAERGALREAFDWCREGDVLGPENPQRRAAESPKRGRKPLLKRTSLPRSYR